MIIYFINIIHSLKESNQFYLYLSLITSDLYVHTYNIYLMLFFIQLNY